ncbi:MAG: hypothetical protein ABI806_15610 [Candidatus Solibacter sp.]
MQTLSLQPIREAIGSGEFKRAQLLWDSSAARLAEEFESDGFTQARLDEIRELVEWSRTTFLCDRAHLQDQLRRLQAELRVTSGYQSPDTRFGPATVAARF